ncbi:hypothetical protein BZA77DRAFT_360717 [Pyronema omphalodes]|nr:hypothetical protein BZA77DRAFT_362786 [Pyronema omphalodes]KAI5810750.1 hypothetical protein BZA77DRAFT_360717 [Pyronema omphalodes]
MSTNNTNDKTYQIPTAMLLQGVAAQVVPGQPDRIRLSLPDKQGRLFEQEMARADLDWLVKHCTRIQAAKKTTGLQTTPPAPSPDARATLNNGTGTPIAPGPGASPSNPVVLDDE